MGKNRRRREERPNRRLPTHLDQIVTPQLAFAQKAWRRESSDVWTLLQRPFGQPTRSRRLRVGPEASVRHLAKTNLNPDRFASLRKPPVASVHAVFGSNPVKSVCSRRAARTQILHALGKTGRAGQKKPRWTERSRVTCKRR